MFTFVEMHKFDLYIELSFNKYIYYMWFENLW
jgi:hypothetical protein